MIHYSVILIDNPSKWGENIHDTLSFIRSCGYEGLELNLTPELVGRLDEIGDAAEKCDLVIPSFLTGAAYAEGLCLSSPRVDVRKRTVERLIGYLDFARRFNAVLVVGLLQGLRSDEPDTDTAQARIVEALKQVGAQAEKAGVDLVIEPVNHLQVGFNHSVREVRDLIEAVGSPAFYPMVDTIHMNIEETSLIQPVYDCGETLRHVHLCESHGGLPGTGHLDFHSVIQALNNIGYDRFASVKVYRKAGLREAAEKSMAYFRTLSF
jgi:sugar phosphate isomerase/epimerase